MSRERNSLKVRLGRKAQELSWLLRPIDPLIAPFIGGNEKEDPYGLLVLLAPPRSGSTLTYQMMRSGIQGSYLSNLQNLLYANPLLGHQLQKRRCGDGISSFRSLGGFVPGLCGESEGLRFWRYWIGQGLEEKEELKTPKRAGNLMKAVQRIDNETQGPFMTGFLGHVFAIDTLRSLFPKVHFIHLKRDLLSNAASLYRYAPNSWKSSKPLGYEEHLKHSREEQIAEQIISLHQRVLKKRKEAPDHFIEVAYEELCRDPIATLKRISLELNENGCPVSLKELEEVPHSFETKQIPTDDPDHESLKQALEARLRRAETDEIPFFRSIFRSENFPDHETD